jgi:hypothetical protein
MFWRLCHCLKRLLLSTWRKYMFSIVAVVMSPRPSTPMHIGVLESRPSEPRCLLYTCKGDKRPCFFGSAKLCITTHLFDDFPTCVPICGCSTTSRHSNRLHILVLSSEHSWDCTVSLFLHRLWSITSNISLYWLMGAATLVPLALIPSQGIILQFMLLWFLFIWSLCLRS